ncbi:methyltransferase domain-containing protein [Lactococcus lactis subsp. lactis]|jgi:SAM-dependent methyltransferase|nr:methyltransferase domain-containing protein [Lactococcus lactis subsp. lactis]
MDFKILNKKNSREKNMTKQENYYAEVFEKPWGRMFYDLLFPQLLPNLTKDSKILSFGSGFGRTETFLMEQGFEVTGYEPDVEKLEMMSDQTFRQLTGTFDDFAETVKNERYDVILIHNVLEYVLDRKVVLELLLSLLTDGGTLSIVKHSKYGSMIEMAAGRDNPQAALDVYENEAVASHNHGDILVYDDDWLTDFVANYKLKLQEKFGIRHFYGISQNAEIKETDNWYQPMLKLEQKVAKDQTLYPVARLHHLIFKKTKENLL